MSQPTDRAKLIDKIQKLMALSTSSNEHEAARAAAKAAELMLQHNIAEHELEAAGKAAEPVTMKVVQWPDARVVVKKGRSKWEGQERWEYELFSEVCWGFNVSPVWDNRSAKIIGRGTEVEVVAYTWLAIRNQLLLIAKQRTSEARRAGDVYNPLKWKRDWLLGAAAGVRRAFQAMKTQSTQEPQPSDDLDEFREGVEAIDRPKLTASAETMTALITTRQLEQRDFIAATFPDITPAKERKNELLPDAYWDGHEAGQKVQIRKGLEGK